MVELSDVASEPETLVSEGADAPLPKRLPPAPEDKAYKYDPREAREKSRGLIAQALIGILALVILFSFVTLWTSSVAVKPSDIKDLLSVLLGPIAALAGSATGFYFGGKDDSSG